MASWALIRVLLSYKRDDDNLGNEFMLSRRHGTSNAHSQLHELSSLNLYLLQSSHAVYRPYSFFYIFFPTNIVMSSWDGGLVVPLLSR